MRLRFPQDKTAYIYTGPGDAIRQPWVSQYTLYTDPNFTILADVQDLLGNSLSGSIIFLGEDGLIPDFMGPNDGTAILYARAPTGETAILSAQVIGYLVAQMAALNTSIFTQISGFYASVITMTGVPATDTAAIQNAINSGGRILINGGSNTWTINPLVLQSGAHIDLGGCTLKLANGINQNFVSTANFSALTGSNGTGGSYNWSITNGKIDGNKANNTAGYGLAIYGYDYRLSALRVRNCASDGIYSEWSNNSNDPGPDSMESVWSDVKSHNNGGNGVTMLGPHDSKWDNVVAYNNAAKGFSIRPNGGALIAKGCHAWGNSQTYGWEIKAQVLAEGCTSEGASIAQVLLDATDCSWLGGQIFAAGGGPIGFEFGVATHPAVISCTIKTEILNCTSGAIHFTNDGGNNIIDIVAYQTSGTVLTGTRNGGTSVFTTVSGGATGNGFLLANGPFILGSGGATLAGGAAITGGDVTIDQIQSYRIGNDIAVFRDSANTVRTNNNIIAGAAFTAVGNITGSGSAAVAGPLQITGLGNGLQIKSGANATIGTGTLVGGKAQIFTSSVTANTMIFLTKTTPSGTSGNLVLKNIGGTDRQAGAWFFVSSEKFDGSGTLQSADTSSFIYMMVEPI